MQNQWGEAGGKDAGGEETGPREVCGGEAGGEGVRTRGGSMVLENFFPSLCLSPYL